MGSSFHESTSKLLLILGKVVGRGVIESGHVFTYGKVERLEYQDEDSTSLMLTVETSKGERKLLLSEKKLIIDSCEPVELQKILSEAHKLIVALQTFITGQAAFDDTDEVSSEEILATQCPKDVPQKKKMGHAKQRVQKKPIKKIEREDSSSSSSDESEQEPEKELVTR